MRRYPNKATHLRRQTYGPAWFYQNRDGIIVCAEVRDDKIGWSGTTLVNLSWKRLCEAVNNHRAIVAQRKRKRQ